MYSYSYAWRYTTYDLDVYDPTFNGPLDGFTHMACFGPQSDAAIVGNASSTHSQLKILKILALVQHQAPHKGIGEVPKRILVWISTEIAD